MKKQIARLCLGMSWCLPALVPVHAASENPIRAGYGLPPAGSPRITAAAEASGPAQADTLRVIFFTDIHVTPGNAQDSLFRIAVDEANASDAGLVVFGGDLTNMGLSLIHI